MLLLYVLMFTLGLFFGSFISALTWRVPRSIQFIRGRSMCPKCSKNICWFDNIPLFSFLFLRGKCRNCKEKISFRYPVIEMISGISFLLIFIMVGTDLFVLIPVLILFLILFAIFIIDLENQIIPDFLVFTGIGIVLIYTVIFDPFNTLNLLFAGLVSSSFLIFIHLLTKGKGMGLGDVKFAVFGGMLVGMKLIFVWFLMAFLTGGITGAILILFRKAGMKTKVPFGPFLILGIGLTFVFGDKLLNLLTYL